MCLVTWPSIGKVFAIRKNVSGSSVGLFSAYIGKLATNVIRAKDEDRREHICCGHNKIRSKGNFDQNAENQNYVTKKHDLEIGPLTLGWPFLIAGICFGFGVVGDFFVQRHQSALPELF